MLSLVAYWSCEDRGASITQRYSHGTLYLWKVRGESADRSQKRLGGLPESDYRARYHEPESNLRRTNAVVSAYCVEPTARAVFFATSEVKSVVQLEHDRLENTYVVLWLGLTSFMVVVGGHPRPRPSPTASYKLQEAPFFI